MSMSKITHIVVHYSATYADQNMTAADIDRMHRARGFRKIGYHRFIRRDGTVEIGRPYSEVGAHVGGQNSGKIGICWAGGLERATGPNVGVDNRTAAQTDALIATIRDILRSHPNAKVVGHRDLAATLCPAFDVPRWWAGVQSLPAPNPTPVAPDAPVTTPNVREDDAHTVERGDTWWSISREHGLSVDELLALNAAKAGDVLGVGDVLTVSAKRTRAVIRAEIDSRLDELEARGA